MIRTIRKNLVNFAAIVGLMVIASAVSVYILSNQRLRFPIFEDKPFEVFAEFQTAQAVTAGQGQTVRVAGVRASLLDVATFIAAWLSWYLIERPALAWKRRWA